MTRDERIQRRIMMILGAFWILLFLGAGILAGSTSRSEEPGVTLFVWLSAILVVAGAVVYAFMRAYKRSAGMPLYSSALNNEPKASRKAVGRSVGRGKAVEDVSLVPLAIRYAEEMKRRALWLMALFVVVTILQVVVMFTDHPHGAGWFAHAFPAVAFAFCTFSWFWLRQRAIKSERLNEALL